MRTPGCSLGFVLLACGCQSLWAPSERFSYQRLCMGVKTTITLYADSEAKARSAADAAFARIAAIEAVASDYRPESEAMQLCAKGQAVVSPDLWNLLMAAQETWKRTQGAFDVTLGPCVQLWRAARQTGKLPSEVELEAARRASGMEKVALDAAEQKVRLLSSGMRLDFGGIAKGYAAEAAVRVLERAGHPHCLVALDGDVFVGAAPPGTQGWRIELHDGNRPWETLLVSHCAVSTSGAQPQGLTIRGKVYAHVVDPATGLGATKVATVHVVAPPGASANSYATAFRLLGPKRADPVVRELPRTAALFPTQSMFGLAVDRLDPENLLRFAPPAVESRPTSRP